MICGCDWAACTNGVYSRAGAAAPPLTITLTCLTASSKLKHVASAANAWCVWIACFLAVCQGLVHAVLGRRHWHGRSGATFCLLAANHHAVCTAHMRAVHMQYRESATPANFTAPLRMSCAATASRRVTVLAQQHMMRAWLLTLPWTLTRKAHIGYSCGHLPRACGGDACSGRKRRQLITLRADALAADALADALALQTHSLCMHYTFSTLVHIVCRLSNRGSKQVVAQGVISCNRSSHTSHS